MLVGQSPCVSAAKIKIGIVCTCIEVRDNGVGISEEDLPFLFDRFYRGTMAREHNILGSGLGLALVREIAILHGGLVESEVGVGSVFTVWLPLLIKRNKDNHDQTINPGRRR
jgi:signal transduction histidine kinase